MKVTTNREALLDAGENLEAEIQEGEVNDWCTCPNCNVRFEVIYPEESPGVTWATAILEMVFRVVVMGLAVGLGLIMLTLFLTYGYGKF